MFAVGYGVGPQFVRGVEKWCPQAILCRGYFTSVLCCNLCWRKWPVTT
ncbi:hypothetical protein O9992_25500 [Vibrio lentus]|nr:hypothetical protein [Vibrio lentus]